MCQQQTISVKRQAIEKQTKPKMLECIEIHNELVTLLDPTMLKNIKCLMKSKSLKEENFCETKLHDFLGRYLADFDSIFFASSVQKFSLRPTKRYTAF